MKVGVVLFLGVTLALTQVSYGQTGCPSNNHQEALSFRPDLAALDLVRREKYIALQCCATGYSHLRWFRYNKINSTWVPWPPIPENYLSPKLSPENQTLEIPSTTMADNTTFRCEAGKGSEVISHKIRLYIYECMDTTMGPILTYPFPENKTIKEFGGNATFSCTGYFGCHQQGEPSIERQAYWSVKDKGSPETVSPRYHTKRKEKSNLAIVTNTLTITNITAEDLRMTFVCNVDSPGLLSPKQMYIRISNSDSGGMTILYPWLKWVLIGAGCLALVVMVTMTVAYCKGPQIVLAVRSHVPQLAQKTVSAEDFSYNVFLCHADEDHEAADKIRTKLIDFSYIVFMSADISGFEYRLNAYQRESKKSAVIMMLYSENLKEDRIHDIFLKGLINSRDGRDIIILEMTKFVAKDAAERTQNKDDDDHENQRSDTNKDVSISVDVGDSIDGAETNEDEVFESEVKTIETVDIKFWNCLKRFKVPDEKAPDWKRAKFYCSLRNRIPQFKQLRDRKISRGSRERNSSSAKPLMTDEVATPNGIDNPQGPEMSPVDVGRFQFNDTVINGVNVHEDNTAGAVDNERGAYNSEGYDSFQAEYNRQEITEESWEASPENVIVKVDVYQDKKGDGGEMDEVRGEKAENEEGFFTMSGETSAKELEKFDENSNEAEGGPADMLAEGVKSDTVELSPMRKNEKDKFRCQFTFEQKGGCEGNSRLPGSDKEIDSNQGSISPESGYNSSGLGSPSQTIKDSLGQ